MATLTHKCFARPQRSRVAPAGGPARPSSGSAARAGIYVVEVLICDEGGYDRNSQERVLGWGSGSGGTYRRSEAALSKLWQESKKRLERATGLERPPKPAHGSVEVTVDLVPLMSEAR